MIFDIDRYEELSRKKDKTEAERNEYRRMYFMEELLSGLETTDMPVNEFYDEIG